MTTSASKISPELSAKRVRLAKEFLAAVQDVPLQHLQKAMGLVTRNCRWAGSTKAFMALQYAIAKSGGTAIQDAFDNEALVGLNLHTLVSAARAREEGRSDWRSRYVPF